jgi:2-keto-4-pentenoate hydratase/2-oxohepta-3-ene-1,7-dioic acid hydratase in catechol pathway
MNGTTHWIRYTLAGQEGFGILWGETIQVHRGDLFAGAEPTGEQRALADVHVLTPCKPSKMLGLWNNFHQRAEQEGLQRPGHPLYFVKANNCFAAHRQVIQRPATYRGQVVFEGELGLVIGQRCSGVSVADAPGVIFGYTCVNDVTARDVMRLDPAFVHWTRAKSFDSFGVFGPVIATGIDPAALRVRAVLGGIEQQNYPVSDMFFSPAEIVSHLSHDMTLEAGDVIACGTSVGAGPMQDGQQIEIIIEGVGHLSNRFGT